MKAEGSRGAPIYGALRCAAFIMAFLIMAFLGGLLAFVVVVPSVATAQPSQLHEVRASAFTFVGSDGSTVLANLAPAHFDGAARLNLHDAEGTRRLFVRGHRPPPAQWRGARSGRVYQHGATN